MIQRLILSFVFLAGLTSSMAQITVELLLDQRQYLPEERLPVGVRVVNHTGQTLELGHDGWVRFIVEGDDGYVVSSTGTPRFQEPFELESSYMATKWINITPYFNLSQKGSYKVRAIVKIEEWDEEIVSRPMPFELIEGVRIWDQTFGVPNAKPGQPPEIRKYQILQANYIDQLKLYFRLTDEDENEVHAVYPIANVVQNTRPQAKLDTLNRLHLLTRIGKLEFIHATFGTDGRLIQRHTYLMTDSRPRLEATQAGSIYVNGGQRELNKADFPVVDPEILNTTAATEAEERQQAMDAAVNKLREQESQQPE